MILLLVFSGKKQFSFIYASTIKPSVSFYLPHSPTLFKSCIELVGCFVFLDVPFIQDTGNATSKDKNKHHAHLFLINNEDC